MSSGPARADWRPKAHTDIARLRASMLDRARRYFAEQDILLVDTPALSKRAVSDPNIESIAVTLGTPSDTYYLHTSPEYCMKRLLADGFPDIAQICRVFRDGEVGRRHQPEFTLIEWYRLDFELSAIMRDTETFIQALLIDATAVERLSYRDAFLRYAGVDPFTSKIDELRAALEPDADLAAALGDDRNAWLDLMMTQSVAPNFDPVGLTTIYHYPHEQAALARLCPEDDRVADRFEVFCGELELANGYVELTDHREQAARFAHEQDMRQARGATQRPLDVELIAALRAGLPECAGVAIGFERLLMLRAGAESIWDVLHFPFAS